MRYLRFLQQLLHIQNVMVPVHQVLGEIVIVISLQRQQVDLRARTHNSTMNDIMLIYMYNVHDWYMSHAYARESRDKTRTIHVYAPY